jgi:hypothetical protein
MTQTAEPTSAPPALYDHCVNTYRAMLAEARTITPTGSTDELTEADLPDNSIIVYEGFLTQLVTSKLNLSVPYYTSIRRKLLDMGCVRQLKRGGGTSPSQWELIYEPSLQAFTEATPRKTPTQDKEAAVQEQLDNMNSRLSQVEANVQGVMESLAELFGSSARTQEQEQETE